jgi:hypothetical protein
VQRELDTLKQQLEGREVAMTHSEDEITISDSIS